MYMSIDLRIFGWIIIEAVPKVKETEDELQ